MATTDHAAELHRSICKRLIMELSDLLKSPSDFLDYLIETGCVDASRLYEVVSSVREGTLLDSVEGRDLADGSNCKLTAAYGPVNGQRTAYGWTIKVTNCTGDVRAIFTRPKQEKLTRLTFRSGDTNTRNISPLQSVNVDPSLAVGLNSFTV